MKIAMPLMIARYISKGTFQSESLNCNLSIYCALPNNHDFLQPDLGTSVLIAFSGLVIVFLSGIKKKGFTIRITKFLLQACLSFGDIYIRSNKKEF
ncbi:MAG: hypothetical protein Ct9H300mP6_01140 [Gammaproteobacteria bacterium]|nr:MAG: hypothetical protein Ct9H300mP6_01140 [Gammaproteobacteria bacterium]